MSRCFRREVMFHSQPVAWVLGETLEAARQGAARVIAEYEPLPPILTIEDAIAASSFHSGPVRVTRGDPSVIETQRAPVLGRACDRRPGTFLSGNAVRDFVAGRDAAAWRWNPPRSIQPKRRRSSRACWASRAIR